MRRAFVAAMALVAVGGCQGQLIDPAAGPGAGEPADSPGSPPVGDAPVAQCGAQPSAADTVPTRILTSRQYDNAVRALLGEGLPKLGQTTVAGGAFDNAVAGEASSVVMPALRSTAEAVAAEAFARGVDPGCEAGMEERACAAHFVHTFGRRAFRRPVEADDEALLMGLYDQLRAPEGGDADHDAALEGVVAAMLQMPRFLYRIEGGKGRGEGPVALDGYEMASRLSFFLWNSIPDDALLDAAEGGELDTEEGVRRTAEAMLDDPRARVSIAHLFEQVLGLDRVPYLVKDPEKYKDFTQTIGEAMRQETLAFIETVVFDRDGTVADLYDADFTMLDETLARFYGIEGVEGDELRPVELAPETRSGLLTHGSYLAQHGKQLRTNPVARGVHVIRDMLCWRLPDPPADVPPLEEEVGPESSVREQLEAHLAPGCVSCHQMIDPIGLAFESYDTLGRSRTTDEGGNPVDTSSELQTPSGESVPLDDAVDLSEFVARSEDSAMCTASNLFANAFARQPEQPAEWCLIEGLWNESDAVDVPIRQMLVDIAASDMFRHRMNEAPEVCE